jgi:hypothetical protein
MEANRPVEGLMEPGPKKKRGCFFWGCLSLTIVFVVVGGCTGFLMYEGWQEVKDFTDVTPEPVPQHEVKAGEYEELQARIVAFSEAGDGESQTLELTAGDLNTLVVEAPDFRELSNGTIFVRIEEGEVLVDLSLPVLSDRYLNGTLGVELEVVNGRMVGDLKTVIVKGQPLQEGFFVQFLKNVLDDIFENANQGGQGIISQTRTLEVKDGKMTFSR